MSRPAMRLLIRGWFPVNLDCLECQKFKKHSGRNCIDTRLPPCLCRQAGYYLPTSFVVPTESVSNTIVSYFSKIYHNINVNKFGNRLIGVYSWEYLFSPFRTHLVDLFSITHLKPGGLSVSDNSRFIEVYRNSWIHVLSPFSRAWQLLTDKAFARSNKLINASNSFWYCRVFVIITTIAVLPPPVAV